MRSLWSTQQLSLSPARFGVSSLYTRERFVPGLDALPPAVSSRHRCKRQPFAGLLPRLFDVLTARTETLGCATSSERFVVVIQHGPEVGRRPTPLGRAGLQYRAMPAVPAQGRSPFTRVRAC